MACDPRQTQQLPLWDKAQRLTESHCSFVGRTATYPSRCRSQTVCPVNLFVGCEPVRGLDSDCSNIYSRSQRPVGKEDAIRYTGQVLASGPPAGRAAGGNLGAHTALAKASEVLGCKGHVTDLQTALLGSKNNGYHLLRMYH